MDFSVDSFSTLIFAILLSSIRYVSLLTIFPAFTLVQLPNSILFGISAGLMLPVIPVTYQWLSIAEPGFLFILTIAFKEGMIGLALGFLTGLPIWAISGAGDLVDLNRGADSQGLFNPALEQEGSPTGAYFTAIAVLIFVTIGGFMITVQIVFSSYTAWPLKELFFDTRVFTLDYFLSAMSQFAKILFIFASPFLIAMFMAETFVGTSARLASRYGHMDLSLIYKSIVYLLLLPFFTYYLLHGLDTPFQYILSIIELLET